MCTQEHMSPYSTVDGLSTPATAEPRVAILLCTYNGALYLNEQLNSFNQQSHQNWQLWSSDDGSQDDTVAILRSYQESQTADKVRLQTGPQKGFVENFMSLTCQPDIEADFYAYADQDDIWEQDKLQRAISKLKQLPDNKPALYCSRTRVIDQNNRAIGFSPLFNKPPSFANALVQSVAGANTMVFNRRARELLRELSTDVSIVSQDWWAYLVITGCGGTVIYDPYPSVRYRQHGGNLVGANSSWTARAVRLKMVIQGRFKNWNNLNLQALHTLQHQLTEESRVILQRFKEARNAPVLNRLKGILASGVYRQTKLGTLSLLIAALFCKI
jgi:glycosyltransferase involved in cell wall biosynthesis